MGRKKSTLVKRTAHQLIKEEKEIFDSEFDHNKKLLGSTMPSKKMRNKIAGYIARLVKQKQIAEKNE